MQHSTLPDVNFLMSDSTVWHTFAIAIIYFLGLCENILMSVNEDNCWFVKYKLLIMLLMLSGSQ